MALELELTKCRNSLWDAIRNWLDTAQLFGEQQQLDWNDPPDQQGDDGPSISDFPSIGIFPLSIVPAWFTHEMMLWPTVYQVRIWTQDWALPEAEDTLEKVIDAIYRATPAGSTVTYVKAATGFYPTRLGPITFARALVGKDQKTKSILTEMHIGLNRLKDPFTGNS